MVPTSDTVITSSISATMSFSDPTTVSLVTMEPLLDPSTYVSNGSLLLLSSSSCNGDGPSLSEECNDVEKGWAVGVLLIVWDDDNDDDDDGDEMIENPNTLEDERSRRRVLHVLVKPVMILFVVSC